MQLRLVTQRLRHGLLAESVAREIGTLGWASRPQLGRRSLAATGKTQAAESRRKSFGHWSPERESNPQQLITNQRLYRLTIGALRGNLLFYRLFRRAVS